MRNNKTTAQAPLRLDEVSWILQEKIEEVLPVGSVIVNNVEEKSTKQKVKKKSKNKP